MFNRKANVLFNNDTGTCKMIPVMHEQMNRLYEAARTLRGLEGPSAVARVMNVSPQTVNNWEDRGISNDGLLKAQESIGCNAIWLRDGVGHMSAKSHDIEADEIIELITLYQQATIKGRELIMDLARTSAKGGVARWKRAAGD